LPHTPSRRTDKKETKSDLCRREDTIAFNVAPLSPKIATSNSLIFSGDKSGNKREVKKQISARFYGALWLIGGEGEKEPAVSGADKTH